MPSRLAVCTLVAVAGFARPCFAQKVISTHPPLSPADAVSVLRSSHSLSDMANRPAIDPDGPHIYVFPYDRSIDVPPAPLTEPYDSLAPDGIPLLPYGSMFGSPYGSMVGGGFPYAPFNGFISPPGFRGHGVRTQRAGSRRSTTNPQVMQGPRPAGARPPTAPPRSVTGAAPAGKGAPRR